MRTMNVRSRKIRTFAKLLLSIVALLIVPSCATNMVTYKASQEHYQYWSILSVQEARISDSDLWLLLELKRERSNFRKVAAVRIPNDSVWVADREGKMSCPGIAGLRLPQVFPSASNLSEESAFPSTGQALNVQELELDAPRDIGQVTVTGNPWAVVFVKFKAPKPGTGPKGGWPPALLVAREAGSGRDSDKCVFGAFFIGTSRNEAWAILAPFAIVSDVVTLPLQLIGALMWLIHGE